MEGEAFYGRCLRLIADMDDAEAAFRDVPPRGPLRIEVHGTLGRHLLLPHLPAFLQRYPEIELEISEGDRYVDLLREGVDAALRVGALADSDLAARRLTMLRSEEHTSELQSQSNLVCRLLLVKKKCFGLLRGRRNR